MAERLDEERVTRDRKLHGEGSISRAARAGSRLHGSLAASSYRARRFSGRRRGRGGAVSPKARARRAPPWQSQRGRACPSKPVGRAEDTVAGAHTRAEGRRSFESQHHDVARDDEEDEAAGCARPGLRADRSAKKARNLTPPRGHAGFSSPSPRCGEGPGVRFTPTVQPTRRENSPRREATRASLPPLRDAESGQG